MTGRPSVAGSFAMSLLCVSCCGCHRGGGSFLLNAISGVRPLSVALVTEQLLQIDPFGPYEPLRRALKKQLDRPVRFDLCVPFQLDFYLNSGSSQFAFVPPAVYARLADRAHFPVLAAATDLRGRVDRPGLLVVKADSDIQTVADLRGKVVAFGRGGDARTSAAALDLLRREGVTRADLKKELLPLPGSLKHLANARAVGRSVRDGSSAAGFVDLQDWERGDTPGPGGAFSREGLRIVARTRPVPDMLLVASSKADPAVVGQVRTFMLAAGRQHAGALQPLALSGYERVSEATLAGWLDSIARED